VTRRRRRIAALALAVFAFAAGLYAARPRPRSVSASIDYWAARYDLNVHLVRAVAWVESGNNQNVVSSAGARGVMQVQPDTWRFTEQQLIGHRVRPGSDGNVHIGVAYLHHLLRVFHGDRRLALAAYNEGPAAVRRLGVHRSVERYVANVLALSERL
jgi:soluble lytic murein transglycosylase-like protein